MAQRVEAWIQAQGGPTKFDQERYQRVMGALPYMTSFEECTRMLGTPLATLPTVKEEGSKEVVEAPQEDEEEVEEDEEKSVLERWKAYKATHNLSPKALELLVGKHRADQLNTFARTAPSLKRLVDDFKSYRTMHQNGM